MVSLFSPATWASVSGVVPDTGDQPTKTGAVVLLDPNHPKPGGRKRPFHHSGLCDGRQRQPLMSLRRDGRPDAGAGAHADGAALCCGAKPQAAIDARAGAWCRAGVIVESTFDRNTIAALRARHRIVVEDPLPGLQLRRCAGDLPPAGRPLRGRDGKPQRRAGAGELNLSFNIPKGAGSPQKMPYGRQRAEIEEHFTQC